MFWGTAVYGVTIALLFLMGLAAQQILPNVVEEFGTADAVIPALAIKILPPGLTGLALSGILSVMMSTADSYLLVSVQTVVSDLGKTFHPAMKEKQEILFSRIASVVLALGALVIALYIKSAYDVLMFAWAFYAAGGRTGPPWRLCTGREPPAPASWPGCWGASWSPWSGSWWASPWVWVPPSPAPSPAASCWWESAWPHTGSAPL